MKKPDATLKLKNGFKVHNFILLADIDYVFSKTQSEDFYRLLNVDEFGHLSEDDVQKLIDSEQKVILINNDTLDMDTYNVPEEEMVKALMEMGR